MHIPDGFLDTRTTLVTAGLAAAGLTVALRQARVALPPRRVPLLGLAAAFVFAAQMLNFPVAGGTSGHLGGGVLAAVLLGPSGAVVVLTAVLIVQCLMFADGGLLALGANVFNLGIVGGAGGYYVYRLLHRLIGGERGRLAAAAFAAWASIVGAAVFVAAELWLSGTVAWSVGFPAMAGVHMLIGAGEAVITTLVLLAVARTRPELLEPDARPVRGSLREVLAYGAILSLGLAVFVSPFASVWPDGLEKVAETLGFLDRAAGAPLVPAPIPDYAMPGVGSARLATAAAGAAGTVAAFLFAWVLARVLVPPRAAARGPEAP